MVQLEVVKPNSPAAIRQLIQIHGSDVTLNQIMWAVTQEFPHVCIKCNGKGYTIKKINVYPIGLPDSGWVDALKDTRVPCDLCRGYGNTKDEYEAKPTHIEYVKKH